MIKRCLVADNNKLYLQFMSDLMESFGYEVIRVTDGLEALDYAQREVFDLFVLDYVMPKIDGIRLSRYIKSQPVYRDAPIILITAAALESIKTDKEECQADILVAKGPFDKMREIFSEILPNLSKHIESGAPRLFGTDNIYPRQIVKELLKVEVHHSIIFRNLFEGVVELEETGKVVFANNAFCEIIGCREAEVVGKPISDVLNFKDSPELRDAYHHITGHEDSVKESTVFPVRDRAIHFTFYNLIREKHMVGSFVILQDVTSMQKKIQEIGALFNITQAFLSDIPAEKVLEYVIFEMRRLINAVNVIMLMTCNGVIEKNLLYAADKKMGKHLKQKIHFWVDKIKDWKKEGLINVQHITKLTKVRFDNLPILWFPLVFKNKYFGTLLGFKGENEEFAEDDMRFMEAIGNQIAVYMGNLHFYNKALPTIQKEVGTESIMATAAAELGQGNDIFGQNMFLRWELRNRKKLTQRVVEDVNRNMATCEGYFNMLNDEKLSGKEGMTKQILKDLHGTFNKINYRKEEILLLNKSGSGWESEAHFFSMDMLARKIMEETSRFGITFSEKIPVMQRLGDFERLVFNISSLLRELHRRGGKNIHVDFDTCNEKIYMIISLTFDKKFYEELGKNKNTELIAALVSDEWQDIDDGLYYHLWQVRSLMDVCNGGVETTMKDNRFRIQLEFSSHI